MEGVIDLCERVYGYGYGDDWCTKQYPLSI